MAHPSTQMSKVSTDQKVSCERAAEIDLHRIVFSPLIYYQKLQVFSRASGYKVLTSLKNENKIRNIRKQKQKCALLKHINL